MISTVAGGGPNNLPALAANLHTPLSVVVDPSGNLFIATLGQGRVYKVDGSGQLTHVAGGGWREAGDGGTATSATLSVPEAIAIDSVGNLFIAERDGHRIRRVDAVTGIITTVAGNGSREFFGDGRAATSASLSRPRSVALDTMGNLFIADSENMRIRRVDAVTGIITTVAGNGLPDSSGDGGPAASAGLSWPSSVALDAAGNLFIADQSASRIRRVDAVTGIITTVAGGGFGVDGGLATTARLFGPTEVALDAAGNLFIAEAHRVAPSGERIRRVDAATGIITTVAGGGSSTSSGDGGPATSANLAEPHGVALDADGNLFITDTGRHTVRRVDAATGIISRIAGNGTQSFTSDGAAAVSASLSPSSVAVDRHGNLLVADYPSGRVRHVDAVTGFITTVAGNGALDASGDGGPATNAGLEGPLAIALDHADNLFIASLNDDRIRHVDAATGIITTFAALGWDCFPGGVAVDAAGNVFVACPILPGFLRPPGRVLRVDAVTGDVTTFAGGGAVGVLGDGGPATSADLRVPGDVLLDAQGNLLIADSGNRRVRHVDVATGVITTIAGAGDPAILGDGGLATSASLEAGVSGLALDSAGNLFIASGHRIRRVDAVTRVITTVAGDGCTRPPEGLMLGCFGGDGGPATSASLHSPADVKVDSAGSLYIADSGNNRVRKVAEAILAIAVDIKPGSIPNSINPMERGVIPVAILGSESFDVSEIDGASLIFAAGEAAPAHDLGDPAVFANRLEDVNSDGIADLVSHYRTEDAGIAYGDMTACLSGTTVDGVRFNGCDAVRTVPDMDGDRLLDPDEQSAGTNAFYRDSDNDGYDDGTEVHTLGTNPLDALDPAPAPVAEKERRRQRNRRR